MSKPKVGTICWRDIWSADKKKATKFYADLFGWEATDFKADVDYALLESGDHIDHFGGAVTIDAKLSKAGLTSSQWIPYFQTEGLDAIATKATAKGASTILAATPLHIGRFNVMKDPHGAFFSLWETAAAKAGGDSSSSSSDSKDGNKSKDKGKDKSKDKDGDDKSKDKKTKAKSTKPKEPKTWVYNLLSTADAKASASFYADLFGDAYRAADKPRNNKDKSFAVTPVSDKAAIISTPVKGSALSTGWLGAVKVADIAETTKKAIGLGGKEVQAAVSITGVGVFAVIADNSGAQFVIIEPAKKRRKPKLLGTKKRPAKSSKTAAAKKKSPKKKATKKRKAKDDDSGDEGDADGDGDGNGNADADAGSDADADADADKKAKAKDKPKDKPKDKDKDADATADKAKDKANDKPKDKADDKTKAKTADDKSKDKDKPPTKKQKADADSGIPDKK